MATTMLGCHACGATYPAGGGHDCRAALLARVQRLERLVCALLGQPSLRGLALDPLEFHEEAARRADLEAVRAQVFADVTAQAKGT